MRRFLTLPHRAALLSVLIPTLAHAQAEPTASPPADQPAPQAPAAAQPQPVYIYAAGRTGMVAGESQINLFLPDPVQVANADLPPRPRVQLSLQEVIRKTIRYNLQLETNAYDPAIAQARVVEAQAAFDAIYFLEFGYFTTDAPPNTPFTDQGQKTDGWSLRTGLRQRLPTGARVEGRFESTSTFIDPAQRGLYFPNVSTRFVAELSQPLLRGFGLDYNRAQIEIERNDRRRAIYTYQRQMDTVLRDAYRRYWQLVLARRDLVIQREVLERTKSTLRTLLDRQEAGLDVLSVNIATTRARLGLREAEFIEAKNRVFDAEDALKNIINDPDLNLSMNIEIVPLDLPLAVPVVIDRLAEIQTALDNRSDLQEARLAIENARISVGVTRNDLLPRLDAVLRFTLNGVDENFGASFNQALEGDYYDIFVGANLEIPLGNRAAEARHKIARLQLAKASAAVRRVVEDIILDVNVAGRAVISNAEQLAPALDSADAAREQVRTLEERSVDLSPEFLDTLLNAFQTQAANRRTLLQALVNYNIALAELERAKGTLLPFHNIQIIENDLPAVAPGWIPAPRSAP